jgi:hypothetical protein
MKPLSFSVVVLVMMATTGCVTESRVAGDPHIAISQAENAARFIDRGDYPEELGIILHDVFATHGFNRPWIAVRDADSSVWFVAERWESDARFDRLFVRVAPKRSAHASITPYFLGPTDWAVLGRTFANPQPEADAIAAAVVQKWKP